MKNNKKRTTVIICAVLSAALLIFAGYQMTMMGSQETLFFSESGLPTIFFEIAGVLFGVLLIIIGKNVDENNSSLRKLCRVIGILEIASSVLYFIMVQLLINAVK